MHCINALIRCVIGQRLKISSSEFDIYLNINLKFINYQAYYRDMIVLIGANGVRAQECCACVRGRT